MSSHARFLAAAAALAAGLLAVTTGAAGAVPADSGSPGPSGPPPMTGLPSMSASPGGSSGSTGTTTTTTWKFYSANTSSSLYKAGGQPVANPSTPPAVGDYASATDNDYTGDHANHASDISATDHLYCLFTKAPATATCSAQLATSQGMLFADNSVQDFSATASTQTYKITGGTGAYQGAKGTFVVTQIANTNNADVVVTWSN